MQEIRVSLVGAKGAGISSLILKLQNYTTHNQYKNHLDQLVCHFEGTDLSVSERPERNEHLRRFRSCFHIAMIVADRTSPNFRAEVEAEFERYKDGDDREFVVLVATKSDAPNCCVTQGQVVQCAKDLKLSVSYLISSEKDDSIRDLFRQSLARYFQFKRLLIEKSKPTIDYDDLISQLQKKLPVLQQDLENTWFGFRAASIARKIGFLNELISTLQDNPKLTIKELMTIIGEKFEKELDSLDQNLLTNISKKKYYELTPEIVERRRNNYLLNRQSRRNDLYLDVLPLEILRYVLSGDELEKKEMKKIEMKKIIDFF